ncbi:DUF378 domain-containing protein [Candidatus Gracilibacteria bacterium]|nr:DUF378 domain-containing protein [Candidatus Gracilibacteria bacterium]
MESWGEKTNRNSLGNLHTAKTKEKCSIYVFLIPFFHENSGLKTIILILIIVGGLNWGLVGIFNFDLVATIFGEMSPVSRVVYSLVGIASVIGIFTLFKNCCKK